MAFSIIVNSTPARQPMAWPEPDALEGAELAQAGHVGVEEPHAGGAGHGQDSALGAENIEFAGVDVHAAGADAALFSVDDGGQQAGGLGAVEDAHAQALELAVKGGLEGGAPDAQGEAVLVVVCEHQLRLVVAEGRALKLVFGVSDLAAEGLHVQEAVIALAALYVVRDAVAVVVLLVHVGPGNLLGGDAGAGVGAGALPVVEACAAGAGALGCALLHEHD